MTLIQYIKDHSICNLTCDYSVDHKQIITTHLDTKVKTMNASNIQEETHNTPDGLLSK